MWQRFTENARQVIFIAQEEALALGDSRVSTRHILLAQTRIPSRAALALAVLGVDMWSVRTEIELRLDRGNPLPAQDMTLTPRGKKVIDLAYAEARGLNNNYIGTEHLLLGLLREEDGLAGRVLRSLGLQLNSVRDAVCLVQSTEEDEDKELDQPSTRPCPPEALINGSLLMADLLAHAWQFAQSLGQQLQSEHLLLALCRREDSYASDILARHGITVESLLEELRNTADEPDDPPNRDE